MQQILRDALIEAIEQIKQKGVFSLEDIPAFEVIPPTDSKFGADLSTNVAMVLASQVKANPRQIAQQIIANLKLEEGLLDRAEQAGPGFINFYLHKGWWYKTLARIEEQQNRYGSLDLGRGQKVQVEFVSANPTGPLHIGHGRGAAVGDVLARILAKAGYQVQREYYINDAGLQISNLGRSTWARYQQLLGRDHPLPDNGYKGDYIWDIAREVQKQKGDSLLNQPEKEALDFVTKYTADSILEGIRQDLERFRVHFDFWFSEKSLYEQNQVQKALNQLKEKGFLKEEEGALWLKSSEFGDEKDRVVIRSNGEPTYLASDIAYHHNKYQRGYNLVIDIWGADHHGYVDRLKAAVAAMGYDPKSLHILLIQLVSLVRNGKPVAMSTRSGEFDTLAQVLDEVGTDAARFFFLTRRCDSQLEFDLELAKQQSSENPVYYVQYAHARICSILRQAQEQGISIPKADQVDLTSLAEDEEIELIKKLAEFPSLVAGAARALEPHRLTFYALDVASRFHKYYHRHRVISPDQALTGVRIVLVRNILTILKNTLDLLGISAPEQM